MSRHVRSQSGFTLVEMLIASTVGIVVLLAVYGLVDTTSRTTHRINDRVDSSQRGRIALDQIVQRMRSQVCYGSEPPIISADSNQVTFYADVGNATFQPERRQLVYSNGTITENVWEGTGTPPNMTWPGTPTTRRNIATGIAPVSGTPIFRYWGFTQTSPIRPTAALNTLPLSATDRAAAVKIDINFQAAPSRGPAKDGSTLSSSVVSRTSDPTEPTRGARCS